MITESRIVYFRHILGKDGRISAESFFRVKSNADEAAAARIEAAEWAGKIGTPLKIGGGGQNVYSEHADFLLDSIEINEMANEFIFELKLTGIPKAETWTLLPGSERIEENGSVIKKMQYSCFCKNTPSAPHEGEIVIDDDGKRLICNSSKITDEGGNHKKLSVIFKSITPLFVNYGNSGSSPAPDGDSPEVEQDGVFVTKIEDFFKDNIRFRKAVFYWTAEVYGEKCAELRFWDDANTPTWADSNFILEKMESTADGGFGYFVELTAREITDKLVSVCRQENSSNKNVTAVYHINKKESASFENLIGLPPSFVSGDYIVTQVSTKELNPLQQEIAVTASLRKETLQLGDVFNGKSEVGTDYKKASFLVAPENTASVRENLYRNAPAEWAGENYYVESFTEQENQQGTVFTVKAVEIYTRMLSLSQEETFAGFNYDGTPCRNVTYISEWQVLAEDAEKFFNLSGLNAEWCGTDAIITNIIPKQLSDLEYRIKMEAQLRSNSDLHKNYNSDNYENLHKRTDLNCELIDFRFSPKDCGYFLNCDGLYDIIPDWEKVIDCPVVTDGVLPVRCINASFKILRISESTYHKGSMNKNINEMLNWTQYRIFNGKVGGCSGSYLKSDLHAKEIFDNHGSRWTKITKVYDLAPVGKEWNPYFFRQF